MWNSNPTWGAPRIQAELGKIGIEVSDSTIRRYRPLRVGPPSQTRRTFLDNHLADLAAIDFFIVPPSATVSCMKSMAQRSVGRPGIAGTCRLNALFCLRGFFLRRLSPSSRR